MKKYKKMIQISLLALVSGMILVGCSYRSWRWLKDSIIPTNTHQIKNNASLGEDEVGNINQKKPQETELDDSKIDISTWLTFQNDDMGVEFQYPDSWKFDEYFANYSWKQGYDEGGAWVKFLTEKQEPIVIVRQRNTTIDQKIREDTEISYQKVKYFTLASFKAANIQSLNELADKDVQHATWVEIEGSVIYMPDINVHKELSKIIETLTITKP